jgi:drug/metabolite transporter (DMT)-like permease
LLWISSRILPDFVLADLLGSPASYSLVLGGGLALYLYSMALQRGSAIAATTPLIAVQTMTPAAVGVLFLGDEVRSGWWPAAVLGFAITAVSAIVLVRFEGARTKALGLNRPAGRQQGGSAELAADGDRE